jgi:hypothetical protein
LLVKKSSEAGFAIALRLAASSAGAASRILHTGTSIFFPVSVTGISGTCTIRSGTWRGRVLPPQPVADLVLDAVVEPDPVGQPDEQRHEEPPAGLDELSMRQHA